MDQTTLERIYKHGTFYAVAGEHYGNSDCNVICDNCRRANINSSYGLENYDICIKCYNNFRSQRSLQENKSTPNNPCGAIYTGLYFDDSMPMSRMEVDQFTPTTNTTTTNNASGSIYTGSYFGSSMPMSRMEVGQFEPHDVKKIVKDDE